WDLLAFKNYNAMCLQYSRGCPFNCEFCDITLLYGQRPRTKNREQVLAELESLYNQGWRGGVF
ncbi:MAG TPA: B12-binding domain-containing radical SAM protein, partial [Firmicutes bacterium]|nr:B12-binding domain-containing radical SAM protein [Bacillota bacterium]